MTGVNSTIVKWGLVGVVFYGIVYLLDTLFFGGWIDLYISYPIWIFIEPLFPIIGFWGTWKEIFFDMIEITYYFTLFAIIGLIINCIKRKVVS